ncbi:tumor protein p63-regulated gene 1 protein [Polypterus senegalus]|uniref:tumor protein p63-regulated gene 1 protein n=1 Tax=Polypterus senegalus TaxID=55291 RepID=UPI0019650DD6|nr:tumor protein p63-regulated gene 1 protein [Polypterus senegalus]
MSKDNEDDFKAVELGIEAKHQESVKSAGDAAMEKLPQISATSPEPEVQEKQVLDQPTLKRFFVLRQGAFDQAVQDVQSLSDTQKDGRVLSSWLLSEVDHWNHEKERIVLITENSLLICKYDFMMLKCEHVQRVPLNIIDRIIHGSFTFPEKSLDKREGKGVRIHWDRLREPSFMSRWNPMSLDFPYCTLISHPVKDASETFGALCELDQFREKLSEAAMSAHEKNPVPGKANGVLVLNQAIQIDTYVGLVSYIMNQNKLGYCLARGNIGF